MAEQFQNFYVTKLREACDATATTIYVDTVPAITEGTLVLEYANSTKHEIIHFTGVSGYGLTGCTRGLEGTTAQSHSAGTDVRQNLTAGIIDKIINGVITTENIANSAVTTAKINNGAVTADKIDFTTLEGTKIIRFGSKKIMWGRAVINNVPSGQDKTVNITFPEEFENTPAVAVTCAGWIAIRAVFCNGTSKTGTTLGAMHQQGNTLTINLDWIAIG